MSPESMDDNLEHAHSGWLQRLRQLKVPCEEAQAVLLGMKARLEFLRNLHSRIADRTDFAEEAREVEREIEKQADEIKAVERYIEQANGT
jgi:hypothetical protein